MAPSSTRPGWPAARAGASAPWPGWRAEPMGRFLLVRRLAVRNVRRRPVESALLLLVIMAATTTLTLGLALRGVTDSPYERTREARAGPAVFASVGPDFVPTSDRTVVDDEGFQRPAELADRYI